MLTDTDDDSSDRFRSTDEMVVGQSKQREKSTVGGCTSYVS